MPFFMNNYPQITIRGGTFHDFTTDQDYGQRYVADAHGSINEHSSRDYSHDCLNSFDSGTTNNIGSAQNVNTGANYGRINQQDSRWAGYGDYAEAEDEDEDEERECSSSPCQAPMGYFQGAYQNFPAPMNPRYAGHCCDSPNHPPDGPRGSSPHAAYQRGFCTRRPRGAARGNIRRGGHPQPGPHSYHAENDGVHPNEGSPEGSLIGSNDEDSRARSSEPTHSISPPPPTS